MELIQAHDEKSDKHNDLDFAVRLTLINFKKEKVYLEFCMRIGQVFNKSCYIFYCYNKTTQRRMDEVKNVMIGSISHDFRTPLGGLVCTLQSID